MSHAADLEAWTISYLSARGDSPWRWADDGEVLAWADGTTIAFRGEVAYILEWLVPHGWPPFGALVWLLAATRGKLPPRSAYEPQFVLPPHPHGEVVDPSQPTLALFHDRLRSMYETVEAGLATIAALPGEQRSSPKAKAVLAENISGDVPNEPLGPSGLSKAVEILRSGLLTDVMLNDRAAPPTESRNEVLVLYKGLKDFSAGSLELRAKTGLDEVPVPAEVPEIASVRVRALLDALRTDDEHAGLARLARDFMAALQLPRRLSELDEMPIGGFADLSNRGNLDRLLLSELAHDDLTLAVRIALNEALYLRREPPSKQPPGTLAVLIDSGVRQWGVPRVLSAAIALALVAKSAGPHDPVIFRASGDKLQPVDLLSRPGLIAHLGTLEPHAHPGLALEPFRRIVDTHERAEAILITHRDVLQDATFQRALAAASFEMLYLAIVDREGHFELLRHPHGGTPVCQARMNIEDLWPSPAAAAGAPQPLLGRAANRDLPISLSCAPFPLLLSVRGKVQAAASTHTGGGICVMQDGRLLQWEALGGARTIASGLPGGKTLWLGIMADAAICVIKAHHGGRATSCRVFSRSTELIHAHHWPTAESIQKVEVHGDVVLLVSNRTASARSLTTGEQLGHLDFPRRIAVFSGRYLCALNGYWSTLVWDGLQLRLEKVPLTRPVEPSYPSILRIFDRHGHEGAWWLTASGIVGSPKGDVVMEIERVDYFVEVSEDGHRLLVKTLSAPRPLSLEDQPAFEWSIIDLPTLSRLPLSPNRRPSEWLGKFSRPAPPFYSVRVRLTHIAIDDDASLHLRDRAGVWRTVLLTGAGFKLVLDAVPGSLNPVPFEPVHQRSRLGFSLKVARWPDGRCAWLDDRGMLHLRSANRARPEVTIVLSDTLAMWSSDGLWTGPKFFIGERHPSDPSLLLERLRNFCHPAPLFRGIEA